MKMPKRQNRHCPNCNEHTEHKVRKEKVGAQNRRKMAEDQRRFDRKMEGYGSFPRPKPSGREKPTRKVDLRFQCTQCKKEQIIGKGFRVKRLELEGG